VGALPEAPLVGALPKAPLVGALPKAPLVGALPEAPLDWAYANFPLQGDREETLSLEWLVNLAHQLIDLAEQTGNEAHFGPVLHWAHILKSGQGPDGDWPVCVNARTGASVGAARTRKPAELLARLDALLDSSEFEVAVAQARAEVTA
jgi:hypothetical protein